MREASPGRSDLCHRVAYLLVQSVVPGWFRSSAVVATTQLLLACALLLLILGVAWPSLAERVRLGPVPRPPRQDPSAVVGAARGGARSDAPRRRPGWKGIRTSCSTGYVIEIRDGALAVGAFDSGDIRDAALAALAAKGLSGPRLEAAVEAVSRGAP